MDRSGWKRVANGLSWPLARYKRFKRRLKARFGLFAPPAVVAYAGFGTSRHLEFGGRVLEQPGVVKHRPNPATRWQSVRAMVRRFRSDELPCARVRAHFRGQRWEAVADEEGYFTFRLALEAPLAPGWHEVEVEVVESLAGGGGRRDRARVLVPPEDADFAILSDVDDTVIETHATDRLQMLRTVFLHDAHARTPFPGVSRLYEALVGGPSGAGHNPIFYLSRSPWNLYDLFNAVLEVHRIPAGPLFLRDFALLEAPSAEMGREHHKLTWLRRLLATYPRLPFILIGDSGQQDPEIYERITLEHPGRVRAILIREVTRPRRHREVRQLAREVGEEGVPIFLCATSTELAARLATLGLIAPEQVERIERRREQVEEQQPDSPG